MNKIKNQRGFTLIEILVVIGIIAILATVVLIAINPARQFQQARNSQRTSNVNAILNAVGQYMADHKGQLPADIAAMAAGTTADLSNAATDICTDVVTEYMPALPADPNTGIDSVPEVDCGSYNTGYEITKNADGRITISAPSAELGATIEVTR